ncbi:hypothetical protein J7444_08060 [Labrenzia sp. R4_1]|uniref:hypothetical protein n=1 Tax=Labrenzia sp. R4_1 TaxID=2821106 RepID=UPI001ADA7CCF|nr:hypothetical protein [Labrenzia sp. R4_1]MBO9424671.1 hypothetical protein [Labrenzia sp. R4_1]
MIDTGGIPYVSEKVCEETDGRSLWCYAYAWQTLIAGMVAFAGAFITVRYMRRERRTEVIIEVGRIIDQAQATIDSLNASRRSIANLQNAIVAENQKIPRHILNILAWEGSNISQDASAVLHNKVRETWNVLQQTQRIAASNSAQQMLTIDDADGFAVAINKIDQTIAAIENELIEPLIADLRKAGLLIQRDENGLYRYDRKTGPKL